MSVFLRSRIHDSQTHSTLFCPQVRESGRRLCVVIVAEGAQDVHGKSITSNQIKDVRCLDNPAFVSFWLFSAVKHMRNIIMECVDNTKVHATIFLDIFSLFLLFSSSQTGSNTTLELQCWDMFREEGLHRHLTEYWWVEDFLAAVRTTWSEFPTSLICGI